MGHKHKCYEKHHVLGPWEKNPVIPLENLLAIMSMGQGFGAFANNKTEQWLSADTGSKLIQSGQEY